MRGSLRILMYHRVLDAGSTAACSPSVISATPAAFDEQMRQVARRYRALSLDEALECVRNGRSLPARAVLITFDDGCRDFGEVAWPILRRYKLPATVFVPSAFPGHPARSFWWDRLHAAIEGTRRQALETPAGRLPLGTVAERRAAVGCLQRIVKRTPHAEAMRMVDGWCRELGGQQPPPNEVLRWDELRALAADGATIGAHTRTHPALTQLSTEEAREEIRQSAADVRREIGSCPPVFAYPFGDHDDRIVQVVREEGFELALTCLDGHNRLPGDDRLRLRRIGITRRTTGAIFRLRMTPAGSALDRWRHGGRGGAHPAAARPVEPGEERPARVAYVMSRFPKLSETFVLNEMAACAEQGIAVELYPLLRERQPVVHPEVDAWVRRAHYHPFVSPAIVRSNWRFLREQPVRYAKLAATVLRETWRSPNFLAGAIGIFPKSVRFADLMRQQSVTHVHAHFATHPALAAFIVHRLTGIPFSFTAHGSDLHVDRRMLDTKVAAAAFAIAVSSYNREVIVRECGEGSRGKVHVVHCGVDPLFFGPRPDDRRHEGLFRVVCVASFEEVKGHRYLVEACALLRARGVPVVCDLIGEGPLRRAIEARVAAAGLRQIVRFHGGLPRPEVSRLLAAADAAVLASHPTRSGKREGIPVALMEAMASGLPVVATAISGIPELVQSGLTGFLVPPRDPDALADALQRLAADPDLRQQMGTAGRARVMRDFDLRANAATLARMFTPARGDLRVRVAS